MATNILPTIDQLTKSKNYQNLASIDLVKTDSIRTPEWQNKKFLADLVDLYKSVQYQVFNIYDDSANVIDTKQFRSGLELFDYISQNINQGTPYSCNVYYNYDKKHIVLLNNEKLIMFIPNVVESKKIKQLETLIESKVRKILKEVDDRMPTSKQLEMIVNDITHRIEGVEIHKNIAHNLLNAYKAMDEQAQKKFDETHPNVLLSKYKEYLDNKIKNKK